VVAIHQAGVLIVSSDSDADGQSYISKSTIVFPKKLPR